MVVPVLRSLVSVAIANLDPDAIWTPRSSTSHSSGVDSTGDNGTPVRMHFVLLVPPFPYSARPLKLWPGTDNPGLHCLDALRRWSRKYAHFR
jgi:hypothetical protein